MNTSAHVLRASSILLVASALLMNTSCTGMLEVGPARPFGAPSGPSVGPSDCPPPPGFNSRTDHVRLALEPTCAGCHMVGDSGYFASLTAFESLLVRDSRLVRAGNPDESELVMLLEGRRTGNSQTQMPLGGDPFAVLSSRGETEITIEEIRDWIATLEVPGLSSRPDPSLPTVQRIGANHIELGLRELLGLTEEDFYAPGSAHGVVLFLPRRDDYFDVRSPDRTPAQGYSRNRFTSLGGGSAVSTQYEERSISTTFIQSLVPVAQAWCGMAIRKVGNTALFTVATSATGTADQDLLRRQLADWHRLFLAERATDADIDFVVDSVFAPIEASSDTATAWTGSCAYFIRHPLFVFY